MRWWLFVITALCTRIPILLIRDQSGVVKFYGSFAFNRKRNVLELEIKQDYTSPGTQKYVVRSIFRILPTCTSLMYTLIMFNVNNKILWTWRVLLKWQCKNLMAHSTTHCRLKKIVLNMIYLAILKAEGKSWNTNCRYFYYGFMKTCRVFDDKYMLLLLRFNCDISGKISYCVRTARDLI